MELIQAMMVTFGLVGALLSVWCAKKVRDYKAQVVEENQDAIQKVRAAVWRVESLEDVYMRRQELTDVLGRTGIGSVTLFLRKGGVIGLRLADSKLQISGG